MFQLTFYDVVGYATSRRSAHDHKQAFDSIYFGVYTHGAACSFPFPQRAWC